MTAWKPTFNFECGNENFKLIAHRGNVTGPCEYENNPEYLKETLNDGFEVEVDVWFNASMKDGKYYQNLWLGHDKPQYKIDLKFLEDTRIWCHAKNWQAMDVMLKHDKPIHCFWHQNDDYTFTSAGYVWTYPEKSLLSRSIAVYPNGKPEWIQTLRKTCAGVCSDFLK
jgi:hypothetical protein